MFNEVNIPRQVGEDIQQICKFSNKQESQLCNKRSRMSLESQLTIL